MAFFALLWKARTIEKYRVNYEKEKINSIVTGNKHMEQTLSQRWRYYKYDVQMRVSKTLKTWYPDGSGVSNFFLYLKTDQTFPNFLFKSVLGFVGGIILTYLCFMFFVFQLSISLIHATIMSSIIGVLLTLGLAFSYRIRCLVFLLIPQFFSRVGRYTLTCYALVLILTGPATNTLKNSEVLSESMACSQEQIKTTVHQLNDLLDKPYNSMKDALQMMMERFSTIALKLKETVVKLDRLVLSLVGFIQSSFSWLQSVADTCNAKLGTPYERCINVLKHGISDCKKKLGPDISMVCNAAYLAQAACYSVKPFKAFCCVTDFMDEAILASVRKKLRNFTEHLRAMFYVEVHIHQSYSFSSNTSRSASQVAAGIVTEIRNRADPLLTWLSWSSCVTSLFLLLIIFRAKYYQHMYETRSRFDNRYVTKDLQELDLKRQRQGRETVLPLNRRERAKYITTTSFRLVASEKVYLNRSAVFMAVTTFKLLIHMVADYSLYWVLMTIRYHGRYQSDLVPGLPHSGIHVSGSGFVARLFRSIAGTLDIPLMTPVPSPISCLPDPYPPDLRRYTQIGVLIFLLWFFALFEPYGLRLRHLIMGHYRPERAKARATWLYNHILRTRAGFMKFARRKLHKEYKYSSEASLTLRNWMNDHVPLQCLRSILGIGPKEPHCLLCGTTSCRSDPDSQLTRCHTPNCPGTYCMSCYTDIGQLCTICLSPADYGDLSDVSLEKGSSDDSDSDDGQLGFRTTQDNVRLLQRDDIDRLPKYKNSNQRWKFFTKTGHVEENRMALLPQVNNYEKDFFSSYFQSGLRKIRSNIKTRNWDKKYTYDWIAKLTPENMCGLSTGNDCDFYPNIFFIDQNEKFEGTIITKTKSIGINTDKNRRMFMSSLVKRFTRRKTKKAYPSRHGKNKSDNTVKYETLKNGKDEEKLINIKTSQIIEYDIVGPNKRFYNLTKNLHKHNLTVCQRNFKKVMRGKIDRKIKIFNEIKSMITAIKNYLKSNERIGFTTQINEAPPNDYNNNNETTNDNNGDIDKPIENTNQEDKDINQKEINQKGDSQKEVNQKEVNEKEDNEKEENQKDINQKEVTKKEINQKKISKKEKKAKKLKNPGVIKGTFKAKSSRHRIAGIQAFFSKHWNVIKHSLLPCTQARVTSPMLKEKKNHKRRKKRKCCVDFAEATIEECYAKKDNKHTRNLRISAFLAELEWTKRDYKKDVDGNIDSIYCTDRSPAPITTNKIVGMVQLKNLPFQWREATRKGDSCKCKEKGCSCEPHSDKYTKLLGPISKQKMYAKKALERFRNKINTVEQPVASSLVKNMMNTMNAVNSVNPEESGIHNDSSICLSKRASYYRSFTKETNDNSDIINTDTLFKNDHFMDDIAPDISNEETAKASSSQHHALIAKHELIVSHSSKDSKKNKPRITRRCRCDFYDDLQRRWTKVKKTMSDKGFSSLLSQTYTMRPDRPLAKARALIYCEFKKPITLVKDLCSSLFGPSCTVDTCPNKQAKQAKAPKDKKGKKYKKGQTGTQTNLPKNTKKSQMASQTQGEKDIETQVTSDCDIFKGKPKEEKSPEKGIKLEMKIKDADECEREKNLLIECVDKQKEGAKLLMTAVGANGPDASIIVKSSNKSVVEGKANKSVHVQPDTVSGACQAVNCPNYCHRGIQYDKRGFKDQFKSVDSVRCVCDELVGSIQAFCTCATQHISMTNRVNVGTKPSPETMVPKGVSVGTRHSPACINTVAVNHRTPSLNKKTQHCAYKDVSHKGTVCASRKNYGKKGKDVKLNPVKCSNELSLEGSMCALAGKQAIEPLPEGLTDTGSESSATATLSARSDGTKTDTTICSLATNFDDTPQTRKFRVKVVTKTNQATITDKTRLCDTGTITSDWWSPIIERKAHDEILLEKKKGYNTIERQKRELREYKELKELRDVRKRRRNCGVTTDGRIVTFRSRTQIIPTGLFAGTNDVMSPSRYLLESQKYYNELFSYNFRPPSQMEYACVTSIPKYQEREKIRSPLGSRRNHYHKTKRLEECYSPRRQASPRKRYMDPVNTKPYESPRRRSHTHRHSKNRHYPKNQVRKQY